MKRIPRLSRGGVLTPSQWDAVAKIIEDNLKSLTIQPGTGYTVTNSLAGTSLEIKKWVNPALALLPFQCLLDINSQGESPVYFLSVVWGTVGGVTPTLDGVPLYSMVSDGNGGYLPRPRKQITLPQQGASPLFVYIKARATGGAVTGATIELAADEASIAADSDTVAVLKLAAVNSKGEIAQLTTGAKGYVAAWKGQTDPTASSYVVHRFY